RRRAVARAEYLNDALLRHLLQGFLQLLRLHRVGEPNTTDDFRRKAWYADEGDVLALGQRVADTQRAVIGNADDVASKGLVRNRAVLGKEELRARQRHGLAGAHELCLHATGQFSGA